MSARATAIAFALLAIGLTVAQDVYPGRDWYHGWQYTTIVAIAILVTLPDMRSRRVARRCDGAAMANASPLRWPVRSCRCGGGSALGTASAPTTSPCSERRGLSRRCPDLAAAAFFAPADPQTLPRGDATVTLRRLDASPSRCRLAKPVPIGLWIAFTQLRPAAYIVVRDDRGDRLTITQPEQSLVPLAGAVVPPNARDSRAHVPARYVCRAGRCSCASCTCSTSAVRPSLAAFPHDPSAALPKELGAILSVSDDAGTQHGIIDGNV